MLRTSLRKNAFARHLNASKLLPSSCLSFHERRSSLPPLPPLPNTIHRSFSQSSPPSPPPEKKNPSSPSSSLTSEGKSEGMLASMRKGLLYTASSTKDLILHPQKIPGMLRSGWSMFKETLEHYWLGTKLLWSEMKLAWAIIRRMLGGHSMTRRERYQLIRTTTDMLRLVPFMVFVIVPFMELLLPIALRLFPNMLPSTFTDDLKKEENLKKDLRMRLAIAGFFQETMQQMAQKKPKLKNGEDGGAQEVIEFFKKVRLGEEVPNRLVIRMAQLFQGEKGVLESSSLRASLSRPLNLLPPPLFIFVFVLLFHIPFYYYFVY